MLKKEYSPQNIQVFMNALFFNEKYYNDNYCKKTLFFEYIEKIVAA